MIRPGLPATTLPTKWYSDGLLPAPTEIREATKDVLDESNTLKPWADDCLQSCARGRSTSAGLHKSLAEWMRHNQPDERVVPKNRIASKIQEHFGSGVDMIQEQSNGETVTATIPVEYVKNLPGKHGTRGFTGIRIKEAPSGDSWLDEQEDLTTAPPNPPEPDEDPDDVPF